MTKQGCVAIFSLGLDRAAEILIIELVTMKRINTSHCTKMVVLVRINTGTGRG